jgi:hypothetical protein
LTGIEGRELESLASRKKMAQGLAQPARTVLLVAEGAENEISACAAAPNTVANGGGGSPSAGLTLFSTSLVLARRARLAVTKSPKSFAKRSRRRRRRDALGVRSMAKAAGVRALDDPSDLESLQPPAPSHGNVQALR